MIEVKGLYKVYGDNVAIDNVSFSIKKGEIVGLLGPNGAGKTTIMNIMTGFLSASDGQVKMGGFDVFESPIEAKSSVGFMPETPALYPSMTTYEYLSFLHELKKIKGNKKADVNKIMEKTSIGDVQNRLISNLSKGFKQRVALAGALLGEPAILVLDEPTAGLDPRQVAEVRGLILAAKENSTVILSSHILSEISATCERVLVLGKGKLIADSPVKDFGKGRRGEIRLMLVVRGNGQKAAEVLSRIMDISSTDKNEDKEAGSCEFIIKPKGKKDLRGVITKALLTADVEILEIRQESGTLEEAFLEATRERGGAKK